MAAAGAAIAVSASGTEQAGLVPYRDAAAVARGAELYAQNCAACHGARLQGEANWRAPKPNGRMPAPPHDETGHTWHHPDAQLFAITKHGTAALLGGAYETDMAGFGGVLSDREILEVLAYIKSTWPRRVIETHDRINAGS
nr:c-type cytochrome [Actibacterium sp. MT2.3-13A]